MKERFSNIMICPDGSIDYESGDRPYFHSKFFNLEVINNNRRVDRRLEDGRYIHTKNTKEGTYILIEAKLSTPN